MYTPIARETRKSVNALAVRQQIFSSKRATIADLILNETDQD